MFVVVVVSPSPFDPIYAGAVLMLLLASFVGPGDLYGESGAPFARVAVVQPDERLALAASRLSKG